ncbi:MAG: serine hydrolase [Acidimicrobiia bacterium]
MRPRRLYCPPKVSSAASREQFLDAIRAIAIIRVVLWHTFGAAVITYFFSAVPAMFFVTGSLLAKSLANQAARRVLLDRAKRLLIPLWAFTAGAYGVMIVAAIALDTPDTRVPWHRIIVWLVPLSDPKGSTWEGGYLSAPLWYLRTLLWLLLLSPLLMKALRRSKVATFGTALTLVFALDFLGRWTAFVSVFRSVPELPWIVGDLALYSVFFLLGFVHRQRGLDRITRKQWFGLAGISGIAGAVWCFTQPVPDGVVNNSHPAHLFIGFAWLALAFAGAPWVVAFSKLRVITPVIGWITQRTLTIYLWHSAGVVCAWALIRPLRVPTELELPAVLFVVTLCTLVFVALFGWIEDRAGGRRPRVWPLARRFSPPSAADTSRHKWRTAQATRTPLAVRVAVTTGIVCLIVSILNYQNVPERAAAAPRVPSQAPKPLVISSTNGKSDNSANTSGALQTIAPITSRRDTATAEHNENQLAPALDELKAAGLKSAITEFLTSAKMQGLQIGVMRPGAWSWTFASGTVDGTQPLRSDDTFAISSVTKTFTAALVYKAIEEDRLSLDAPLPPLQAVPQFTYATQFTVRELLQHGTGLRAYRDTRQYRENPASIASPAAALLAAQAEPLAFAPGTRQEYSSSNYLVLGFLLEQVYGRSFESMLRGELLTPLSLTSTVPTPPSAGAPHFSTGGLISTVHDLMVWTNALIRDQSVLKNSSMAAMLGANTTTGIGPGLNVFCPCTTDSDGKVQVKAYGFNTAYTFIQYAPASDLVIVVNTTDAFTNDDAIYNELTTMFSKIYTESAQITR